VIERDATIFLIDDDLSVRRGLERLLRSAGYSVETFASAREFLERGGDCRRAACLMIDVRMPGQSGIELFEALVHGGYNIPAIFISGYGEVSVAVRAMKAGAVDFLPKPFDERTLLDAVSQAIGERAQRPRTDDDRATRGPEWSRSRSRD